MGINKLKNKRVLLYYCFLILFIALFVILASCECYYSCSAMYHSQWDIMEKMCTTKRMPDINAKEFGFPKIILEPFNVPTDTELVCFHFSEEGTENATGESWNNAIAQSKLQEKLKSITDASRNKVYLFLLGKGTYKPTPNTNRGISFTMKDYIAIIGGWNNNYENSVNVYKTIFSGVVGSPNDKKENSYHIIKNKDITRSAVLYGVTVQHGNARKNIGNNNNGGGMYNDNSSPTIIQSTFNRNLAADNGGGIFNDKRSSPMIIQSTFTDNNSKNGKAIYNDNDSNPIITQSIFSSRSSSTNTKGGVMYNNGSNPTIIQSSFTSNSNLASKDGGVMYNKNSNPKIIRSIFIANAASKKGGVIYNDGSNPIIIQSTFDENSSTDGGGAIYNDISSLVIIQSTFFKNTVTKSGGAIYNNNSNSVIIQSTFSGNSAVYNGGAVLQSNNGNNGETVLANVVLWNNTVKVGNGAQIYFNIDSNVQAKNIVLGSVVLHGGIASIASNKNPIGTYITQGDIISTDPMLDTALADNGGVVKTLRVSKNSTIINKGLYIKMKKDYSVFYYSKDNITWYATPAIKNTTREVIPSSDMIDLTVDARGYTFSGIPDIGSYEYEGVAP